MNYTILVNLCPKIIYMRLKNYITSAALAVFCLIVTKSTFFAQTYNLNTASGASSWIVPAGVFCIQVECWGGGGNGGRANSAGQATGGGGGGAYSRLNYMAVTPGSSISYFIGAGGLGTAGASNGGDTWFSTSANVMAKGGTGVALNATAGGAGGQASASIGDLKYNGGNGGTGSGPAGSCSASGGGGGGAGSTGAGNPGGNGVNGSGLCIGGGTGGAGGAAKSNNGGAGGAGASSGGAGTAGSLYGAGGGGAKSPNITGGNRNGGDGARGMICITVVAASVAPTSITGTSTICAGGSTTLTLSGGSAGAGATAQWYSGSCGGTSVGSGNSISVSPGSTTTYYVRYESTCNITTCASVTVTVDATSTAPSSVTGTGTYCQGNTVTLTQSGGSLGGSAVYEWFTGSCGGTPAGTGPFITISPTSTQTYYVRAGANGSCPATACASGTVTMPTAGTALGTNGESATCVVNQAGWVHFYNTTSGNLIASINSAGQNLGNVSVTSYVDVTNQIMPACTNPNPIYETAVMQRHWVITPQFQPVTPVQVRLPFGDGELTTLSGVANVNANPWDNVATIADIQLSKYSGPLNVDNNALNNCPANGGSGGTTIHAQVANGLTTGYSSVGSAQYTDFSIPGFSEFWLHASSMNSPLPIELTSLLAICNGLGDEVEVNWTTASEHNTSHFDVERSIDGSTWEQIGTVQAAGNSTVSKSYKVKDNDARGHSVIYYRLNQVDQDGAVKVYGPTSAECFSDQNSFALFPNPAREEVTILLNDEYSKETLLIFTDMSGKEIYKQDFHDQKGKLLTINIGNFEPGVYLVRLIDGDTNSQFERLVKQ